ncbi:MAG: gliding motility-associated C-terminal domain-containing protein [Flavobacteriales bacterium]
MKAFYNQGIALLFFSILFISKSSVGQDLPEFNMADTTVTECQGILYDSGGEAGIYGNNENITFVINPGVGIITLSFFNEFCLENNLDFLSIYDGPNSGAPLIGTYTSTTMPADISALSGAVTLVMTSDNSVSYCGFSIEWSTDAPDPVPPTISVNVLPSCNTNLLNVAFSSPVVCSSATDADYSIVVNGNTILVTSVQPNCSNNLSNSVTLTLAQPFSFNCDYTVNIHIEIPDVCEVLHPFDLTTTFQYDNCGVNANITANFNPICPGSCALITANVLGCFTYTYSWNNGLPATAGPHSVCPSIATTYSCLITEVETGNTTTKTITIQIETNNITTPPQTVCQSSPDIAMAAQGSGLWFGGAVIEDSNIFDPDLATPGINYVYFQTASCLDSVAITVTPIQANPVTAACPGSPAFQLTATPGGGTWSGPFTTVGGIFDPTTAGSYIVTYSVNGCTDDATVNVDDIGGNFTLPDICQSIDSDQIDFSPLGGTWSGVGITDAFNGIYSPASMPAGDQQFIYTINGCQQIFDIFIKEIEIGGNYHTACPEEPNLVWYDGSPTPPGGFWMGEGIVNASTGLFSPGIFTNNAFTFIYYTAPNGCIDTTFIDIILTTVGVNELFFCQSDPAYNLNAENLQIIVPSDGLWTGPGVTQPIPGQYAFNPIGAGPGEHVVYYERNNCLDSIQITVFPISLSVNSLSFCSESDPSLLQADIVPGGVWSGQGIVDASTGLFDPGSTSEEDFYVYWDTPAGCLDSIAIHVEQFEEAIITGIDSIYCMVDQDFNFQTTPAGGNLTGSLPGTSFNPSTIGPGSYEVIYTVQGILCPATADTAAFEVYPELTTTIAISDNLICDDQSTTVTVTASGGNPNNSYTYTWSNGGFPVNTNTSTPGVTTTIFVQTNDGCSSPVTDSAYIEVLPPIVVDVTTSGLLCNGAPGFASADVQTPGTYDIVWNNTSGETVDVPAGTVLDLTITDLINGCTWDSLVTVPSHPQVVANFSVNPATDCINLTDASSVTFLDLSQNATQGNWSFGENVSYPYSSGQSITQSFSTAAIYSVTLTVQNNFGCSDAMTMDLCVLPDVPVFIPDIFSPNSDGSNDILFVRGIGISRMEFHVYNRWGEEVFSTNNQENGWDGVHRGMPALSGSYFYTFSATMGDGTRQNLQGEIALIR